MKLIRRHAIVELTLAGDDDPLSLRARKIGFLYYPAILCAEKIVAISTKLSSMSKAAGVSEARLVQIPVGVDTSQFRSISTGEKAILRRKLRLPEDACIMVAVGNIEARKAYEYMLRAWKYISAKNENSILVILGPGNSSDSAYYAKLQELIEELNIRNVQFLGMTKNVNEYIQSSNCLLHCATMEGLPNTLLEAALSSTPIVCRQIEGITSDIIFHPSIGYESMAQEPEQFALDVSRYLATLPARTIEVDKNLISKFSISSVADKYISLFNQILTPEIYLRPRGGSSTCVEY